MNTREHWIYLSPHLDDAVLSCGGLIWEQIQRGIRVEIWTLFAGDPSPGTLTPFAQSLHERWGIGVEAVHARRMEDADACSRLGAATRHFAYPDCIYRRTHSGVPVIRVEEDLFQVGYAGEQSLIQEIRAMLQENLPSNAVLAACCGIGSHIDHQLLNRVVRGLQSPIWRYADYPYAASDSTELRNWSNRPGKSYLLPVSELGLQKWQAAVSAYVSQISTFWSGQDQMKAEMTSYWRGGGGSMLRA